MIKKICSITMLVLMLSGGPSAFAQSPSDQKKVPVSDELGKALERALVELESLRRVVTLKDEIITEKDAAIRALRGLAEIERMRAESWAKAAQERAVANVLDAQTIKSFEQSIFNYKEEVGRVRAERDSARRSRWLFAIGGAALGFALGRR